MNYQLACNLLKSSLSNRKQYVLIIINQISQVLQHGSILGPVLFLFCIDDLLIFNNKVYYDTTLYANLENFTSLQLDIIIMNLEN